MALLAAPPFFRRRCSESKQHKTTKGVDMKNAILSGVIVLAAGLLTPPTAQSQGTVYLSSLDQPSAGSGAVGSDSWLAAGIHTGGNPGGYVLDSIELAMTSATGDPSGFTVQLYTSEMGNGAFVPDSSFATLTGSSDPVTAGLYTYTDSDLTLSPSSYYFIVLTAGTPVASGAYAWSYENTSAATTSGGLSGAGGYSQASDGVNWITTVAESPDQLQFDITATAVPEPDTLVLMGLPGVLLFVWRRWQTKAQA
jgi:hypothetical protein